MPAADPDARWNELAAEVLTGFRAWREQHPTATLTEIEDDLDRRLHGMRARLLEDVAVRGAAADLGRTAARPACPACGEPMQADGREVRRLTTTGGEVLTLTRSHARCPRCGTGLFPLDEELGLVPGALTPRLHERLVRLGTWLPFRPAARMLAVFTGVTVSEATARRQTEGAGAAYVALQEVEADRLAREAPVPPAGPALQLVTVDGAMVPLLHKEWGEAKTLTIGTVEAGPDGPRARDLSYFSRRADHAAFARLALVETQARGTETAGTVVGVCDGADWCQGFLDLHRPDAVRVLDVPHAVGYLATAAKTAFGAETPAATAWLAKQARELADGDPVLVLGAIEGLPVATAPDPVAATAAQGTAAEYLGTRLAQIQYARFRAAGYPIGSGAGESANKVVVEGRLKGAGMHWAPAHVDPMLALRTIEYADRWEAVWPRIGPALRASARRAPRPAPVAPARPPVVAAAAPAPSPPPRDAPAAKPTRLKTVVNGKPTKRHPWKTAPCLPGGRTHADAHPEL